MGRFVFNGTNCICTNGATGILNSQNKVLNKFNSIITADIKPIMTGVCILTNKPCTPSFSGNWSPTAKTTCEGKKAIFTNSTLICNCGGTVSVIAGQNKIEGN